MSALCSVLKGLKSAFSQNDDCDNDKRFFDERMKQIQELQVNCLLVLSHAISLFPGGREKTRKPAKGDGS
jgi:hypothetical protein